jgi:hypothetical protein
MFVCYVNLTKINCTIKVHLLDVGGHMIPRVDKFTKEKSRVFLNFPSEYELCWKEKDDVTV